MENKETAVEYAHTIEELLRPLASEDPEEITGYLTTAIKHPGSRKSLWAIASLYLCNPKKYPKANQIPEIGKLKDEELSELAKRLLLDLKAIDEIRDIYSYQSEREFRLEHFSSNEDSEVEDANLQKATREIAALDQFRQNLRLKKGAGSSTGEVLG